MIVLCSRNSGLFLVAVVDKQHAHLDLHDFPPPPSSRCPFIKLWKLAKACLHVDEQKRFESAVISSQHGKNNLQGLEGKKKNILRDQGQGVEVTPSMVVLDSRGQQGTDLGTQMCWCAG